MNWGRAKTILIVMFLAIDILLLCLLAVVNNDVAYIKEDTIVSTVSVLNSRGINISKEQIPKKRIEKTIISYENLAFSSSKAAECFLGEVYEVISDSDEEVKFKNSYKYVSVAGNEINYEVERNINPAESFEQIKETVLEELESFGYDEKNILFENIQMDSGVCHVSFNMTYEGKKVIGTEMNLKADLNGILNLSGRYFVFSDEEETSEMLVDVTSALIGMIYNPEYSGMTIQNIEVMYYIDSEYIDGSEVVAYPVYVVTDSENRQHILK